MLPFFIPDIIKTKRHSLGLCFVTTGFSPLQKEESKEQREL